MKAGILEENDFEDFEEGLELCPICKVNYISEDERMCTTCQEEQLSTSKDDEPDWRGFVEKADEDDDDELDLLPVEEDDEIDEELEGAFAKDLDADFDDMEEDEESEELDMDDDFDSSMGDDYDDFEEDEEDEVEEDDDDLI
jgi:DNA-directed RNA polymerase subunit delta